MEVFKILKLFIVLFLLFSCKSADVLPISPTIKKNSSKEMTSVSVKDIASANIVFNQNNNTYSISIPYDSNIKNLTLIFSLSQGATSNPISGSVQDFTNPINYIVTAEDGSKITYKIEVSILPKPVTKSSEKNIIDFQLTDFSKPLIGRIFEKGGINSIIFHTTEKGPGINSLKTLISVSPKASVNPASLVRTNFSNGDPTFTVTAEDGSTKLYNAKLRGLEKYLPTNDIEFVVTTLKNKVLLIDSESGASIWEYECDSELSPPTSNGKSIFVKSSSKLYSFDLITGKLNWTQTFDVQQIMYETPLIDNATNLIYIPVLEDGLYAINVNSGSKIWKYNYGNSANVKLNSPYISISNNILLTMFQDKLNETSKLIAINISTGNKIWEYESKFQFFGKPAIENGKILVSASKYLFALELNTGKKNWEYVETSSYFTGHSPSIIYNGLLIVSKSYGKLLAFDINNGTIKWTTSLEDYLEYYPFVSDGKLFVNINKMSSTDGKATGVIIHTINPLNGSKLNSTNFYGWGNYTNNILVYNKIIFLPITGSKYYTIDVNDYKICYTTAIEGKTPCLITKNGNVIVSTPAN